MDIIEAIRQRRSVRSYDGRGLTADSIGLLNETIASLRPSPFGGNVTMRLKKFDLGSGYPPATYGMIRGADYFFLLAFGTDDASALSAGFLFEQVVLRAWQAGLATCWIGGTFRGSVFSHGEVWPEGETLRVVCPVGVADSPAILDRITRLAFGSRRRRPFGALFFDGDFSRPLAADSRFGESLEMMRLAPSSTNSQPWRALVADGSTVHFYGRSGGAFTLIDCGIGLCHFSLAERYSGHAGGSFVADPSAPAPPSGLRYIVSCRCNR